MAGCKECSVCTRSFLASLFMLIPKLIYLIVFSWNYGLLKKKCPQCGHFISQHSKAVRVH